MKSLRNITVLIDDIHRWPENTFEILAKIQEHQVSGAGGTKKWGANHEGLPRETIDGLVREGLVEETFMSGEPAKAKDWVHYPTLLRTTEAGDAWLRQGAASEFVLYGEPTSTCTRKVLMTFAEKGVEPRIKTVDLVQGEQHSKKYAKIHPYRRIPVLEDGPFRLYESRAIIRYLDERLTGSKLVPADLQQRALMEQWISVEYSYFAPASMLIFSELLWGDRTRANMARVKEGKKAVEESLDVLDGWFAHRRFLGSDTFSLGDICWMPGIGNLFEAGEGDMVARHAHVHAWWERVSARKSWQKILNRSPQLPSHEHPESATAPTTLEARIRAAYLLATGGVMNTHIKLARLRAALNGEPAEAVNEELRRMQQQGSTLLYPIDDPQRLRPEDEAAAMRVAGERRDLVCIKW